MLKRDPFDLEYEDANLIARYCTEDNTDDKVHYDEMIEVDLTVFKSILRHIIGSYEILSDEVVEQYFKEIKTVIAVKKRNIVETFLKVMKIKEDKVSFEDLKTNFKTNEIKFDKLQLSIILLKLYKETGDADKLPYKLLFD